MSKKRVAKAAKSTYVPTSEVQDAIKAIQRKSSKQAKKLRELVSAA